MYALVMTAPSQGSDFTVVQEIDEPCPNEGEVSINVIYAGINFIDVMARRGDAGYVRVALPARFRGCWYRS